MSKLSRGLGIFNADVQIAETPLQALSPFPSLLTTPQGSFLAGYTQEHSVSVLFGMILECPATYLHMSECFIERVM